MIVTHREINKGPIRSWFTYRKTCLELGYEEIRRGLWLFIMKFLISILKYLLNKFSQ